MDRLTAAHVFVTIAERGSLSRAADWLEMSRPMVTRHLNEMENWVGARLFHRTTRRLSLTSEGESTLARCRELLALSEQMGATTDAQSDEPHGILRLACSQALAQSSLATAVARFLQQHPRAAIDLHVSNQAVNLVDDRIDLAIRITNQLDASLIMRPLGQCPSVVCASPAYLQRHGTPRRAEDLAQHNCLTYAHFGKSLWRFERGAQAIDVPVSGNLSANDSIVLLQAALEGAGVTLQPTMSAAPLIASGQLVALCPKDPPQTLGIHGLYLSRQHQSALLRALLDYLVQWFEPPRKAGGRRASK